MQNSEKLWPIFLKTEKVALLRIPFQSSKILDIGSRYPALIEATDFIHLCLSRQYALCVNNKSRSTTMKKQNNTCRTNMIDKYDQQVTDKSISSYDSLLFLTWQNPVCLNRTKMSNIQQYSNKYSRTNILDRTRKHVLFVLHVLPLCVRQILLNLSLTSLLALASGFIKMDYARTDPELYLLCKESLIIPVVHKLLTFAFRARQWNHEMRLVYSYEPNRAAKETYYGGHVRIVYIASLRLVWSFFHCLLQSNVPIGFVTGTGLCRRQGVDTTILWTIACGCLGSCCHEFGNQPATAQRFDRLAIRFPRSPQLRGVEAPSSRPKLGIHGSPDWCDIWS